MYGGDVGGRIVCTFTPPDKKNYFSYIKTKKALSDDFLEF